MHKPTSTSFDLDLIAKTFPIETIVARTMREISHVGAATLSQICEASNLSAYQAKHAIDRWIEASGIVAMAHPDSKQGLVYWLQPLLSTKELATQYRWVGRWIAQQPRMRRNTLLQIRRQMQPTKESPKRYPCTFVNNIVLVDS